MNNKIKPANLHDADIIAFIVSQSNKDVAEKFKLTFENNPKHPSFYTKDWVTSDMNRGEVYFLYRENEVNMGGVAFEQPDSQTSYLNRLSVLPEYRRRGIGEKLAKYIFDFSRTRNIQTVSIGIIAKHIALKKWYLKLGFTEGETKSFDHLPFDVTYMSYEL